MGPAPTLQSPINGEMPKDIEPCASVYHRVGRGEPVFPSVLGMHGLMPEQQLLPEFINKGGLGHNDEHGVPFFVYRCSPFHGV
ncbi:MAG: hypothetical protein A2Y91_08385 [Chloroflexi bacterium RBG_13_54_8]|nr:MAG: hypothetical protein A2Y91_08385 [Chloroflexi bacterium RBG_13_54_8]